MKKPIEMLNGGRFISQHRSATCYYDSRHKIIKTNIGELIEELQPEPIVNNDWRGVHIGHNLNHPREAIRV